MLRAHAIERTQQRGPYNVLSVLKPKTQDGTTKVSLSADRIRDIFEQHPLIKRVYDENVPKVRHPWCLVDNSCLKMNSGHGSS
jgi:transcription initiation factor TFIIH subunit 1